MAIAIPAIVDTQLTALRNSLLPKQDGATLIASSPLPPYAMANRAADVLRMLTDLIDAGPLTATGGTATQLQDTTAFTGVNTLIGAKVTFTGNVTPALAGCVAYVISNTVTNLNFAPGALTGTPQAGDTYSIQWTAVDKDLLILEQGKTKGDTASNPYSAGPSLINALMVLIQQLGGSLPSWLDTATVNPFHIGSPHAGAGSQGHGGAMLIAEALLLARDQVAAYTKPA